MVVNLGNNFFLLAACAITALAAVRDLRTGEIPNALALYPIAVAPLAHLLVGSLRHGVSYGVQAAMFSILGIVACGIIPWVLWRMNGGGGGDLKLLALVGALCQAMIGIEAQFYAFMFAALFAPAWLVWEGKLFRVFGNAFFLVINPFLPKAQRREITPEAMTSLRFGPAVFAGTLTASILNWTTVSSGP